MANEDIRQKTVAFEQFASKIMSQPKPKKEEKKEEPKEDMKEQAKNDAEKANE